MFWLSLCFALVLSALAEWSLKLPDGDGLSAVREQEIVCAYCETDAGVDSRGHCRGCGA